MISAHFRTATKAALARRIVYLAEELQMPIDADFERRLREAESSNARHRELVGLFHLWCGLMLPRDALQPNQDSTSHDHPDVADDVSHDPDA